MAKTTKTTKRAKKIDVIAPTGAGHSLVMRTCSADLSAYGGFRWPNGGEVSAPDWDPTPRCGGGLHGLLWGEGDAGLLDWSSDAKWLVVSVVTDTIVNLSGKVKFPKGIVVYCGDMHGAAKFIAENGGEGKQIVGGTATAGDGGTATAGYRGTATAGYGGTISIAWWDPKRDKWRVSTAEVGENGIDANTAYTLDVSAYPPAFVKAPEKK